MNSLGSSRDRSSPLGPPLVTLAVCSYNQVQLVEAAVRGAFAQTYSPLELILSDDCSTDGSFAVMERLAAEYEGPHRIVLNRNPVNRGAFGSHLNRVFQLAKGDLIVLAAADDVALPSRVQANVEAWEASSRTAHCVFSGYTTIDQTGEALGNTETEYTARGMGRIRVERFAPPDFWSPEKPIYVGCAMAYSRELLRVFGPLPEDVITEDEVLAFRAYFLGPIVFINEPLVRYRLHSSNLYFAPSDRPVTAAEFDRREQRNVRVVKGALAMLACMEADLGTASEHGWVTAEDHARCLHHIRALRSLNEDVWAFHTGSIGRRWRILVRRLRERTSKRTLRYLAPRLLGDAFYRWSNLRVNQLRNRLSRDAAPRSTGQ
jgi:glycosyltransferase involved in cell wall biosynthesis